MTIVIADDHALLRAELRAELELSGFTVCAEAADAAEAVEATRRFRPDVCLLDVYMPGDGICAAAEIAANAPETKVVMLSASRDEDLAVAAYRAGASGYVTKDLNGDRIGFALQRVLAGELVFWPAALAQINRHRH